MSRSAEELKEIERHKYFLSEKQGYDVGWEVAESDWEIHHAVDFRRKRATVPSPEEAEAARSERFDDSTAVASPEGARSLRLDPAKQDVVGSPAGAGMLKRLIDRIFGAGN